MGFYAAQNNEWEIATIYFKDFKEYVVGEPTGNNLKTSCLTNMVRLGVMTSEKKEGAFTLEIDYIEFIP
jgi:hypothetical protein